MGPLDTGVLRDNVKRAVHGHGSKGACLKLTMPKAVPVLYISTNNGKYCKN